MSFTHRVRRSFSEVGKGFAKASAVEESKERKESWRTLLPLRALRETLSSRDENSFCVPR